MTTTVGVSRFDGYEVGLVIEYRDPRTDENFCERFHGGDDELEDERQRDDYQRDFWTLYGHLQEGGVEAIADRETEEQCHQLMYQISGVVGEIGRDIYYLAHAGVEEVIFDLAYNAGQNKVLDQKEDSRALAQEIVAWAHEFEKKWVAMTEAERDEADYIESVDDFSMAKLKEYLAD
jgi:hypothetical protein